MYFNRTITSLVKKKNHMHIKNDENKTLADVHLNLIIDASEEDVACCRIF